MCLFCKQVDANIEHVLVVCNRWNKVRDKYFSLICLSQPDFMEMTNTAKEKFLLSGGNNRCEETCIAFLQELASERARARILVTQEATGRMGLEIFGMP